MNELELTQEKQITSPQAMIEKAISNNADLDKLEKLLEIQMKWEANEARKAYVKAMAEFKENAPKITKDSKVDFNSSKGRTNYAYANLGDITNKLTPALSKFGLTATWKTEQNGKICVTCKITHCMGHSEETTLCADSDNSGNKNSIQAIGSTITYLERYTLLALCGLATFDQYDDGVATESNEKISKEQAEEIDRLIKETDSDIIKFLNYMQVETYNDILAKDYQKAITPLKNKIKDKQKG